MVQETKFEASRKAGYNLTCEDWAKENPEDFANEILIHEAMSYGDCTKNPTHPKHCMCWFHDGESCCYCGNNDDPENAAAPWNNTGSH